MSLRSWRWPLAIALVILVADQFTKHWALDHLSDGHVVHVIGTLQFNLAFNSGMAFGTATGFGPLIGLVATGVIIWLLVSLRTEGSALSMFGIGCVIGGAAGNLVDRLFRGDGWMQGSVVDFIDFQWFPIFNIADVAVNVGAAALILNAVLESRRTAHQPERDAEAA